jgi:hypothetical protein
LPGSQPFQAARSENWKRIFLIAQRLGYISPTRDSPMLKAIDEVARITYAMISKSKAKESATAKKL